MKELVVATTKAFNNLFQVIECDIDLSVFNFPDVLSVNFQHVSKFLLCEILFNTESFNLFSDKNPQHLLVAV